MYIETYLNKINLFNHYKYQQVITSKLNMDSTAGTASSLQYQQ